MEYIQQYHGTYAAAEDLSEKTGYAVSLSGLNEDPMWQIPGNSLDALDILDNAPDIWETARVVIWGATYGIVSESSDTIQVSDRLIATSDGTLIKGNGIFTALGTGNPGEKVSVFVNMSHPNIKKGAVGGNQFFPAGWA